MTAQASAIKPPERDAVGVAFVLLSGLGVVSLPNTAKFAYCIAYVSFFAGARILGATRASMLSLVEPPAAALGAWLLFGENLSALQWVGFCIVLAAIFAFGKLSRSPA